MDYSRWKDLADSDDEGEETQRSDVKQILALKEAADRTFEAISERNEHRDRYSDCLQMYTRIIEMLDEHPQQDSAELRALRGPSFMNMAAICIQLSNWQRAVQYCQRASKYTSHYKCFYMQAVAWDNLGEKAKSLTALERALQIAPSSTRADEISEMQQMQRRLRAHCAAERDADDFARGVTFMKDGNFQQALVCLQNAVEDRALQPAQKKKAYQALCDCHEKMGNVAKAVQVLEEAAAMESSDLTKVPWLYRAASFAYEKARDENTALRLHRRVCQILVGVIDLFHLSDRGLRNEFASTEHDRDRLLDDAIFELDRDGNMIPLGEIQWGANPAAQQKYATLLACSLTSLGALQIKRQEASDAVNSLKPAVCFLKHKLQQQGLFFSETEPRGKPLVKAPAELHHLQVALSGLSDGFATLQQWDLSARAAEQACVVLTLLGRIDKRGSMYASLGHIAHSNNQPAQVVADYWWNAVRDYQTQSDSRKAGDLLLRIGELYMKDAKIEPFHVTTTRHESAAAAYDAFTEAAKEIKRVRVAGSESVDSVLTYLMLEEDARFNAGLCCTEHRQGALQLGLALSLLNTISERHDSDKQQVQQRIGDVKYHLAVRLLAARELDSAREALQDCIRRYSTVGQRSREKEAWTLLAFVKHQSGDLEGRDAAIQMACDLCVGPIENPVTEREKIMKMLDNFQASK